MTNPALLRVRMTPGPAQASPTNGIGQVILAYARHLPDFGVQLAGTDEPCDLTAAHAGAEIADVAHLHGLIWTAEYPASQADHAMNARLVNAIRRAKVVTVPSEWVAECLRRDMHLSPVVIPHGVDLEAWTPGASAGHDGYVLWNKNRVDAVCDPTPVAKLAALRSDASFISTFCPKPQPSNVTVTGLIAFDRMKPLIQRAGVYLATTRETGRIGVLEAMASGVPVLGFRWGDTAAVVDHEENGYLVEPGDYDGLAEGLDYCLRHRARLSDAAIETARQNTWQRAAECVARVYRMAMREAESDVAVRVVVPCHNKAATIRETISSVAAQTWQGALQLIVVDDGSNDDSVQHAAASIAEVFSQSSRLRDKGTIMQMVERGGVARARNAGAFADPFSVTPKPKYLVFLDGDDLIAPTFIETCVRAMEADPTLGIAYTSLRFIHDPKASRWPHDYRYDWQVAGQNQVPTCCMVRYEAFERAGGYSPVYCPQGAGSEDAELWLRLGALGWGGKHVSSEPLFIYRPGGSTQKAGYTEPPWLSFHPWVTDHEHPFASMAHPRNGLAHPVRSYERPAVSVIIESRLGEQPTTDDELGHTLQSLEAQIDRSWEAVDDAGIVDSRYPVIGKLRAYPYFQAKRRCAGQTVLHVRAGEWLMPDAIALVKGRGGHWRYEGFKLWQM